MKQGAVLVAQLAPYDSPDSLTAYADAGIVSFAMELMPRITRAQSMDVLSSQSNLAGYRAVLDAATTFRRALPMMMTAAGTVPPAKCFVMGTGVAGLQAIATARRMGAVVSATDVRPATKEQVESLGATFVAVEDEEFKQAEAAGGYAKEMSDDYKKKAGGADRRDDQETGHRHHHRPHPGPPGADPGDRGHGEDDEAGFGDRRPGGGAGRQLPLVRAGQGGGKARRLHRRPHQRAEPGGGRCLAALRQEPAQLPDPADRQGSGTLKIDWDDEVIKGTCLTRDGQIVHERFKPADAGAAG